MKIFIKGRKESGREVELEWHDGGPQSIQNTVDGETTQPRRGGLRTWVTTDAINGSLVHFRSKGIYASLMDDNEFLAFIAKTIGEFGNNVSIEYIAPDQDEPLLVTVDRNKITVKMHTTGDAVAASLETALSGSNNDLKFTAKEAGVDGNDISIEYNADSSEDTTASENEGDIVVSLAGDEATYASYTWRDQLVFTAIANGVAGNSLRLAVNETSPGPNDAANHCRIGATHSPPDYGKDLKISRESDGMGGFTTTLQNVIDAITTGVTADEIAVRLFFTVALAEGANGSDLIDQGAQDNVYINLEDGTDATITATADDVKAAIEADNDSDALVSIENASGNDGSGVVTAYGPQNLSGGGDAATIISYASEVKAAIEAHAGASKLVNVLLQNDLTMFEMSETNLSGGDDDAIMEGSVELSSV